MDAKENGEMIARHHITKREEMASRCMAAMVGDGGNGAAHSRDLPNYASLAVQAADALLDELAK